MELPTIKIKDPSKAGDFCTINLADFDPAQHQPFDADEALKVTAPAAAMTAAVEATAGSEGGGLGSPASPDASNAEDVSERPKARPKK